MDRGFVSHIVLKLPQVAIYVRQGTRIAHIGQLLKDGGADKLFANYLLNLRGEAVQDLLRQISHDWRE
jgi:hypothetical protein